MASEPVTEEVLKALAKDYFEIDPSHDTYGPVRVDLWDDKIQTFERAKPAELLLALATEVLAARARIAELEAALREARADLMASMTPDQRIDDALETIDKAINWTAKAPSGEETR